GDLSAQMVAGADKFLMREIENSVTTRVQYWHRDNSSREAYEKSIAPNRDHFRKVIGAIDPRVSPVMMEMVATSDRAAIVAETSKYTIIAVRWPVFDGVHGEGLLV